MSRITFYTNPMSRGQIARWALHEAGAAYDEIVLDYGSDMKSIEYLAVNPMGKVPAIVHEGNAVTEAAAICLYLADAFPEAGLLPEGRAEKADYLRWTFFAAGPVEQAVINRSMGWTAGDDLKPQRHLGYGSYERTMGVLSALFETRDHVCGDRFTAADIYVGSQVDWGMQFGTIPATPALQDYAARLRARPAYKEARAVDAAHIARMQGG